MDENSQNTAWLSLFKIHTWFPMQHVSLKPKESQTKSQRFTFISIYLILFWEHLATEQKKRTYRGKTNVMYMSCKIKSLTKVWFFIFFFIEVLFRIEGKLYSFSNIYATSYQEGLTWFSVWILEFFI